MAATFLYKWTNEQTLDLIRLRVEHDPLFTGRRHTAKKAWIEILRKMGLDGLVTPAQIAKKWDNLKRKYKEIKVLGTDLVTVNPNCWRWFRSMEKVVGQQSAVSDTQSVTSSMGNDDESCTPVPSKRVCQIQVGTSTFEMLPMKIKEDSESVVDAGAAPADQTMQNKQENELNLEADPSSAGFYTEQVSLKRERRLIEEEHAEVDRERVILERERDLAEREIGVLQRERVQLEKDRAALDRDRAALEQERARIEKDRAALDRDRAALQREKDSFTAMLLGRNNTEPLKMDSTHVEDRKRLIFLFEKLIERF